MLRRLIHVVISPLSKRLHGCREARLIHAFRKRPQESYAEMLRYFGEESPEFRRRGLTYRSRGGFVTVCDDIYGYEVRICGGNMIDIAPSAYGITVQQATMLQKAVLSNVEGSVSYEIRHPTGKAAANLEWFDGISWPMPSNHARREEHP